MSSNLLKPHLIQSGITGPCNHWQHPAAANMPRTNDLPYPMQITGQPMEPYGVISTNSFIPSPFQHPAATALSIFPHPVVPHQAYYHDNGHPHHHHHHRRHFQVTNSEVVVPNCFVQIPCPQATAAASNYPPLPAADLSNPNKMPEISVSGLNSCLTDELITETIVEEKGSFLNSLRNSRSPRNFALEQVIMDDVGNQGQDYESLKKQCLIEQTLFEDDNFKPASRLLPAKNRSSITSYLFGSSSSFSGPVEWLRPFEICKRLGITDGPKLFDNKVDRFDVNQGDIGNCWFLAAMAHLAEHKDLLYWIIPPDQSFEENYAGIFRFRFWRFGSWVDVVIDDRLPTRDGELIFMRCQQPNKFWGALLEKAYAKLNGTYKRLEGGNSLEAAVDFTGGIPERIELFDIQTETNGSQDSNSTNKLTDADLYSLMLRVSDGNSYMGCSIIDKEIQSNAERKGLHFAHVYTITKVVELKTPKMDSGIKLIRIRNPHGNGEEWNGKWSDGDKHWEMIPLDLRQKLGLTFEDDGEFFMNLSDFLKYFGELEICHLKPGMLNPSDKDKKFEVFHFVGSWVNGISDGGCGNNGHEEFAKNPQYFFNLDVPESFGDNALCPVVVSLGQQFNKEKISIGFKVYKCEMNDNSLDKVFFASPKQFSFTSDYINLRDVSKRMVLPPGRYCVIPSTYDTKKEGEFYLRVFVEKSWGSSEACVKKEVCYTSDSAARHSTSRGIQLMSSVRLQSRSAVNSVYRGVARSSRAFEMLCQVYEAADTYMDVEDSCNAKTHASQREESDLELLREIVGYYQSLP